MGNYIEPARQAIFDQFYKMDLSDFYKRVSTEVKIHALSFLPLRDLSNLLLISKPLNLSIKSSNEILSIWYKELFSMVKRSDSFNFLNHDFSKLPPSLNQVRIPVSFCENLDHANYYRLKWAGGVEKERNEKRRVSNQCVRSSSFGSVH